MHREQRQQISRIISRYTDQPASQYSQLLRERAFVRWMNGMRGAVGTMRLKEKQLYWDHWPSPFRRV